DRLRHAPSSLQEQQAADPEGGGSPRRQARCRGEQRRRVARRCPGLFLQQRQQGRDLFRDPRSKPDDSRRREVVHQGRNRLRWLFAVGDRSLQGDDGGLGQKGEQQPLRTLRLHATRIVRDRQNQGLQVVR